VSGQNSGALVTAMTLVGILVTDFAGILHWVFSLFLWEDPCGIQRSADPNRNCSVVAIKLRHRRFVNNYFWGNNFFLDFPGVRDRLSFEYNRAPATVSGIADHQIAYHAL
jgi:hypothetical protein